MANLYGLFLCMASLGMRRKSILKGNFILDLFVSNNIVEVLQAHSLQDQDGPSPAVYVMLIQPPSLRKLFQLLSSFHFHCPILPNKMWQISYYPLFVYYNMYFNIIFHCMDLQHMICISCQKFSLLGPLKQVANICSKMCVFNQPAPSLFRLFFSCLSISTRIVQKQRQMQRGPYSGNN